MTNDEIAAWKSQVPTGRFVEAWNRSCDLMLKPADEGYLFTGDMIRSAQRGAFELEIILAGGLRVMGR